MYGLWGHLFQTAPTQPPLGLPLPCPWLRTPFQPSSGHSDPFQLMLQVAIFCCPWIVWISLVDPLADLTHPPALVRWSLDCWWDLFSVPTADWCLLGEGMASTGVTSSSQLVLRSLLPESLTFYWPKDRWFHRVFWDLQYPLSVSTKVSGPKIGILV